MGLMEDISQEGSSSTGVSSVVQDDLTSRGEPSIAEEPSFMSRSKEVGEDNTHNGTNRNGEIYGGAGLTVSWLMFQSARVRLKS